MTIIEEIAAEREVQKARWPEAKDDAWSPVEWAALIARYATHGAIGDLKAPALDVIRRSFIKAAALCIAAIESLDRRSQS